MKFSINVYASLTILSVCTGHAAASSELLRKHFILDTEAVDDADAALFESNIFGLRQLGQSASNPTKPQCLATEFCVGREDDSRCQTTPDFGINSESGLPYGCTSSVLLFLGGAAGQEAVDQFKYGKYCGPRNFCSKYYGEDCRGQKPAPCDGVDQSCFDHDGCLEAAAVKKFGNKLIGYDPNACNNFYEVGCPTNIDIPDRLQCDITFINQLLTPDLSTPTGLCDADFYKPNVALGGKTGISVFGHEAILTATPFCCVAAPLCEVSPFDTIIEGCSTALALCDATVGSAALPVCSLLR